jgi:hypothetical protein
VVYTGAVTSIGERVGCGIKWEPGQVFNRGWDAGGW